MKRSPSRQKKDKSPLSISSRGSISHRESTDCIEEMGDKPSARDRDDSILTTSKERERADSLTNPTKSRLKLNLKFSDSGTKSENEKFVVQKDSQRHLKILMTSRTRDRVSGSVSQATAPEVVSPEEAIIDENSLQQLSLVIPWERAAFKTPFDEISQFPIVFSPFDRELRPPPTPICNISEWKMFERQGDKKKKELKKFLAACSSTQIAQYRNFLKAYGFHNHFEAWQVAHQLMTSTESFDSSGHNSAMARIISHLGIVGPGSFKIPVSLRHAVAVLEDHVLSGDWNLSHLQPIYDALTDVLLKFFIDWNDEKKAEARS